ncbi:MAG: hypothetical protein ACREO8_07025 [Luteimonas sp.]
MNFFFALVAALGALRGALRSDRFATIEALAMRAAGSRWALCLVPLD